MKLRFGPPPTSDLELTPTSDEVERFREDGFLVVERITTDEEIAWLRQILEFVFSPEQAGRFGAPVDRSGTRDDDEPARLSQAFFPEIRFPELLDTTLHRNSRRYAAALLGVDRDRISTWGHAIRKPPGGRAAKWHQDHAYWDPELDYLALGVWTPLHDVIVEMGAMQFIPGSHKAGLRAHHHEDAPEHNLLTVVEQPDHSAAVACPLRAGGATFHHYQTLHYTAPNQTDQVRLAYPVEYQVTPMLRAEPDDMPWVRERRAVVGTPPLSYMLDGKYVEL